MNKNVRKASQQSLTKFFKRENGDQSKKYSFNEKQSVEEAGTFSHSSSSGQTTITEFFKFPDGKGKVVEKVKVANNQKQASSTSASSANVEHKFRRCPKYKFVPGTSFVVDAFKFGKIPDIELYFLSHFHYDHYVGLTRHFDAPICCSQITASLVHLKLKVPKSFLRVLSVNEWIDLGDDNSVILIDANHCPGAVMFLFHLKNDHYVLHTGDFRAERVVLDNPIWSSIRVDYLYLDTTYFNPAYIFPCQMVAITKMISIVKQIQQQHNKLLILVGTYEVGKERIFTALAEALDCKVAVEKNKMQTLKCFDDKKLSDSLTLLKSSTFLHVVSMGVLNRQKLTAYLASYPTYEHLVAIKPTGWEFSGRTEDNLIDVQKMNKITILGVPYSEHSSFAELKQFVLKLRPKQVVPTVNVSARAEINRVIGQWLIVVGDQFFGNYLPTGLRSKALWNWMPCETNNADESGKINGDIGEQTPTTPVRLRRNGNNSTADSHEVIRRGLATLAETDLEENMTEIKKLDSQIDHLNDYMAKVERRNSELTGRLQSFLQSQKEERDKRRASFYQRQQESEAAQIEFNNQVRAMLMRCQQARGGPPIDTSGYVTCWPTAAFFHGKMNTYFIF
ncbi:DNA cross-link repair 1A protein [Trichinella spiralis]|uniref:DNA cross-link repair 1A protein n=1 Tax=Trichinella spiralis TaxID=6334 RepID=A0ABR3KY17_TRISP